MSITIAGYTDVMLLGEGEHGRIFRARRWTDGVWVIATEEELRASSHPHPLLQVFPCGAQVLFVISHDWHRMENPHELHSAPLRKARKSSWQVPLYQRLEESLFFQTKAVWKSRSSVDTLLPTGGARGEYPYYFLSSLPGYRSEEEHVAWWPLLHRGELAGIEGEDASGTVQENVQDVKETENALGSAENGEEDTWNAVRSVWKDVATVHLRISRKLDQLETALSGQNGTL